MKLVVVKGALSTLALVALMTACGRGDLIKGGYSSRRSFQPVVATLTTAPAESPVAVSVNPLPFDEADAKAVNLKVAPASSAVSGRVVFQKDRLFNREFLYGFDLQYSGGKDDKYALIPQAQSLGHIPCLFRRIDDRLQLVADQTRLFESDINHPELLIATYKIIAEDEATLTVEFLSGGLVMNDVMNGSAATAGAPAATVDLPNQVWIRSLAFIPEGEYLLQETALQVKNGSVQTFMETVFPRSNLVPEGSVGLEANANTEPLAARFRFLGAEESFVPRQKSGVQVREKTTFASRFLLKEGQTIDWYVTANAPERLMPIFKSGVEGWNRYFIPELGRPVLRFLGVLPAGIKIGDPRYNVINYDSVAEAGAAYESQATDPLTGYQSHSLIYFPYAWYNIGVEMWKKRSTKVEPASADELRSVVAPKAPEYAFARGRQILACVRSMDLLNLPLAVMSQSLDAAPEGHGEALGVPDSVDEFAKRLMISTLFHEVGHALGLAHNFKGSLALDGTKPQSASNPASWSIMDYNYYQNEQDIFAEIGGVDGPVLEYDRQTISALYNGGKGIKATDPVIPACDDSEADSVLGGVDPFCLRYDAENDPTLGLVHAYHNVVSDGAPQGVSSLTLTQALQGLKPQVAAKFMDPTKVKSPAALLAETKALTSQISGLINFYLVGGAQALRVNLNNNSKALRVWRDGVTTDEAAFRGRYVQVLTDTMALKVLPSAPAAALAEVVTALQGSVANNSAVGADEASRKAAADSASADFTATVAANVTVLLSKVRTGSYGSLAFDLKNSMALQLSPDGALSHFEELAFAILASGVLVGLDPAAKPADSAVFQPERVTAATALATFKAHAPGYGNVIDQLNLLYEKAVAAGQMQMVHDLRVLLALLG